MKKLIVFLGMFFVGSCFAAEKHMMHHDDAKGDARISLKLSPKMKQHQLSNMRSHVEAVQAIVGLMATNEFDKASEVAHTKLGLTKEMREMCGMFGNADFEKLGLAFHTSGDELGEVLAKKDVKQSLSALNKTMGYCVECHATFRQ